MDKAVLIRPAIPSDGRAVHEIYQYYVDHTVWTFGTENPTVTEYEEKIAHSVYPFLVAEWEGSVVGFAYADRIRPKEAYLWDVELTVYLSRSAPKRTGIGGMLYEQLLAVLTKQGFLNAYGVITLSNEGSIRFHERFGFTQVARFENMGYKHGAWHGVVWMHKAMGSFQGVPELPVPFQKKRALDG